MNLMAILNNRHFFPHLMFLLKESDHALPFCAAYLCTDDYLSHEYAAVRYEQEV